MDSLQATYKDDESEDEPNKKLLHQNSTAAATIADSDEPQPPSSSTETPMDFETPQNGNGVAETVKEEPEQELEAETEAEPEPTSDSVSEDEEEEPPSKKQKQLSCLNEEEEEEQLDAKASFYAMQKDEEQTLTRASTTKSKKPSTKKKKGNNVWVTKSSRKGKKKSKVNVNNTPANEDTVAITPVARFPDKSDEGPDMKICLSKVFKAEKVELTEDRMSAGSTKGYRMVRATRGVVEGAWYFEIKVESLGETGHTRLGWSTEKGDLQAPVGYDGNSFGYRDIDGSKVHKALRIKYGEQGYEEGDVIGFYINLPEGAQYAPKPASLVWFKGQRYACAPDSKDDPPKVVPGSEICFFKNGVCQGVAFNDLPGGRYYPAASMYTLPNQPNCVVRFNFGPDFEFFPEDFGGCPVPKPMVEAPYHGLDNRVENGSADEKIE